MSPTADPNNAPNPFAVMYSTVVHFAGMCMLVTDGKAAKVFLPNPAIVKSTAHTPVLLIQDHAGLKGTPDLSITPPNTSDEYGVWALEGRSLEFASADFVHTDLRLDLSAIPEAWEPANESKDDEWASLKALADIGEIAKADELAGGLSAAQTGPVIPIPFGDVKALPPIEMKRRSVRMGYTVDGKEAAKLRAMSDRIAWSLPKTKGATTIRLTGKNPQTIEINGTLAAPIVISNVAAGACLDKGANHFDVYFELVKGQRRAQLFAKRPGGADPPHFPEICRPVMFHVSQA